MLIFLCCCSVCVLIFSNNSCPSIMPTYTLFFSPNDVFLFHSFTFSPYHLSASSDAKCYFGYIYIYVACGYPIHITHIEYPFISRLPRIAFRIISIYAREREKNRNHFFLALPVYRIIAWICAFCVEKCILCCYNDYANFFILHVFFGSVVMCYHRP